MSNNNLLFGIVNSLAARGWSGARQAYFGSNTNNDKYPAYVPRVFHNFFETYSSTPEEDKVFKLQDSPGDGDSLFVRLPESLAGTEPLLRESHLA